MKQLFTAPRSLLGYSTKIFNLKILQTLFIPLILLTLWVFERWNVLSFDLLLLYIFFYSPFQLGFLPFCFSYESKTTSRRTTSSFI